MFGGICGDISGEIADLMLLITQKELWRKSEEMSGEL